MLSKKLIALIAALFVLSLATGCDDEAEADDGEETEEVEEVEEEDDGEEEEAEEEESADGDAATFDASSEEAMNASLEELRGDLPEDIAEGFELILFGYALHAAEEAGIDIEDESQEEAAEEAAQEAFEELDGMTADEIVAHLEDAFGEELGQAMEME